MKLHKRGDQGEIATLLTIVVMLVIGATTFVSSLALKGKKTTETKAGQMNRCSLGFISVGKLTEIEKNQCAIHSETGEFYICKNAVIQKDSIDECTFQKFPDPDKLFIAYVLSNADPENYSALIKSIDISSSQKAKTTDRLTKVARNCVDYTNPAFCLEKCAKPKLCKAESGSNSKRWCCSVDVSPIPRPTQPMGHVITPSMAVASPDNSDTPLEPTSTKTLSTKIFTKLGSSVPTPTPMMCNTKSGLDFYKGANLANYFEPTGLQLCGIDVLADQRKVGNDIFHLYRECPEATDTNNDCLYSCFKNNNPISCRLGIDNQFTKHVLRVVNSSKDPVYITAIELKETSLFRPDKEVIPYCDGNQIQTFENIKTCAKKIDPGGIFSYDIGKSISCPVSFNYRYIRALITYYKENNEDSTGIPVGEEPLNKFDSCYQGAKIQFTIK